MLRLLRILCEIAAAVTGIGLVLGALCIWRFHHAPIRSEIFTPYLTSTIERAIPGSYATIASSAIAWDAENYSLTIHVDAIHVVGTDGKPIADIPSIGGRIGLLELLHGNFLPTELVVDHPQIWVKRQADGEFTLGTPSPAADKPTDVTSSDEQHPPFTDIADFDFNHFAQRTIDILAHAYLTNRLYIRQVSIIIHDQDAKLDWAIAVPEINLRRVAKGLSGLAEIELSHGQAASKLLVNYSYERGSRHHTLSTHLDSIDPSSIANDDDPLHPSYLGGIKLPLSGDISVTVDDQLQIVAASADLNGGPGSLIYPSYWDTPRTLQAAAINFTYDRKSGNLSVPKASIDFGGPKIEIAIVGTRPLDPKKDLEFTATASDDNIPMDQTASLWPKSVLPDLRDWISSNMKVGTFDHAEGVFKGSLSWNDLENMTLSEGKGKLSASHCELRYIDSMPPVKDVAATGTFDLKQMTVQVSAGGIDNLRIQPFQLQITGLQGVDQYIDIPLAVAGPIPDLLRLIDNKPLEYAHALGLPPDGITGNMTGVVDFHFPLLKTLTMKDVEIKAHADFTDVTSSQLVPGLPLSQGNLAFDLTKTGFSLSGPITANKLPMQIVSWDQVFESAPGMPVYKAAVTGAVTSEQWPLLGIDIFKGSHGASKLALTLTQLHQSKLVIDGSVDMTAADMRFDMLSWKKPAGVPAILPFTAELPAKGNIQVTALSLLGKDIGGKGVAELQRDSKQLLSLTITSLIMGRSNATVHIEQPTNAHASKLFDIKGIAFDMSGVRSADDGAPPNTPAAPDEYRIHVDKLFTSENGFITDATGKAERDSLGWTVVDLHGMAQGAHQLDIQISPKNDYQTLTIHCDDFGKALQGLGLTDAVREGDLDITGTSTSVQPRVIEGTIKIGHFQVKGLPVLAQLLNATSPFGWVGIVTNSVNFDRLRGNFRWEGNNIDLTETNAAGTAVGINIEGRIHLKDGDADLHGTIVPFSMMNHVINYIPILGNIITGGKDQGVFAVTYGIHGPLNNPHIGVNPASLLTPGFLRNLFFDIDTPLDKEDEQKQDDKAAVDKAAGAQPTPPANAPIAPPSAPESTVVPVDTSGTPNQ